MIGFIKKDLAMMKSNLKLMGMLIVVYAVMGIWKEIDISFILPFISVMMMISTFSYDNYNKWDAYSITFPNGRKNSVSAKYVATILLILIISIITILLSFIISYVNSKTINYEQILVSTFGNIFGTVLVLSFMYPIIYKFGVEKARIMIFILIMAIVVFGGLIFNLVDFSMVPKIFEYIENYLLLILLIIILLIIYLSYLISLKINLKKEY